MNTRISEKENIELFGKCYSLHGHNYELFVTVTGSINHDSGFIMDLKILKTIIQNKVINKIDHKNLNDLECMKNQITSTENLCLWIWNELENPIKQSGGKLYKIKIKETENNYFEYFGKNN